MTAQHIAVIDIGKTNAKLALVDAQMLTELAVDTRPNTVLPGPPYPHFDTEGHWAFLLGALARFHAAHRIDAISITTHGACAALLAADGTLAAPVLDYEDPRPGQSAAYAALRPDFAETGSPRLAMGLNLGAQLHWQLAQDDGLAARTAQVVTYPQYWAHRLTGVAACDVTSLGCHTDLWNPWRAQPSALLERLGLAGKLAPLQRCDAILGPILPDVARATGLPAETPVVCGIHDSNASLLPHLLQREGAFSVVSTGTWVVVMTMGGAPVTLDPGRDTLVNVNALGQPVPSARFMGGREYDEMRPHPEVAVAEQDRRAVLDRQLMLLPAVQSDSGPFAGRVARWTGDAEAGQRSVALSWYLALMTAECLRMTGAQGPVIVEGPFARNADYCRMLSAATGLAVSEAAGRTGTAIGAALLVAPRRMDAPPPSPVVRDDALRAYAQLWQARVAQG